MEETMKLKTLYAGMLAGMLLAGYAISEEKTMETKAMLPEENHGIVARYPGDNGIEGDSDVLFVEGFESVALVGELKERWDSVSNAAIISFAEDVPPASSGEKSLLLTHIGGESEGGHLYRRLSPGYETLYFRFYTKLAPDCYPT